MAAHQITVCHCFSFFLSFFSSFFLKWCEDFKFSHGIFPDFTNSWFVKLFFSNTIWGYGLGLLEAKDKKKNAVPLTSLQLHLSNITSVSFSKFLKLGAWDSEEEGDEMSSNSNIPRFKESGKYLEWNLFTNGNCSLKVKNKETWKSY